MKHMGGRDYQLWDEQDGFFYDVLRYPDGAFHKFRVRSLVGLIPLFAVERLESDWIEPFTRVPRRTSTGSSRTAATWSSDVVHTRRATASKTLRADDRRPATSSSGCCERIWDPDEFLSDYGIRSLSKYHERAPVRVRRPTRSATSRPRPTSKIKGGNSNWRGPIWFPTTFLLIESLRKLGKAFGPRLRGARRRRRRPADHLPRDGRATSPTG